jgi:hypothetical protein
MKRAHRGRRLPVQSRPAIKSITDTSRRRDPWICTIRGHAAKGVLHAGSSMPWLLPEQLRHVRDATAGAPRVPFRKGDFHCRAVPSLSSPPDPAGPLQVPSRTRSLEDAVILAQPRRTEVAGSGSSAMGAPTGREWVSLTRPSLPGSTPILRAAGTA